MGKADDRQDKLEAEQGAAFLFEALASFRQKPGSVEEPELDAKAILARIASGQAIPDSRIYAPPSAAVIHLVGKVPRHNPCIGKYTRLEEQIDYRHVYQSDDGCYSLWWTGGSWFVGPTQAKGKQVGCLQVSENTDVPEDVSATWTAYDIESSSWRKVPELRAVSDEERQRMVAEALAAAKPVVAMSGETPDGKDAGAFGDLSKGELENDRHVYRNAESGIALWWSEGAWALGDERDIGTHAAFLLAMDDSTVPEAITGVWQVCGGGVWHDAPQVRVAAAAIGA